MVQSNILKQPYIEIDEHGKKWVDAYDNNFFSNSESALNEEETQESIEVLEEKGIVISKIGKDNKKVYTINYAAMSFSMINELVRASPPTYKASMYKNTPDGIKEMIDKEFYWL